MISRKFFSFLLGFLTLFLLVGFCESLFQIIQSDEKVASLPCLFGSLQIYGMAAVLLAVPASLLLFLAGKKSPADAACFGVLSALLVIILVPVYLYYIDQSDSNPGWTGSLIKLFIGMGLTVLVFWILPWLFHLFFARWDPFFRKRFVWLLSGMIFIIVLLATVSLATLRETVSEKDRPNILVFVMDTTRWDRLSTSGYPLPTSPALKALSGEGMLLQNVISTAPWTIPSHASLFTGAYSSFHGVGWGHMILENEFVTLAEILRKHGYQTIGFANNRTLSDLHGMTQGFNDYYRMWEDPLVLSFRNMIVVPQDLISRLMLSQIIEFLVLKLQEMHSDFFSTLALLSVERTVYYVLQWIDTGLHQDRPFFVFINCIEPHLPYTPPPEVWPDFYKAEHVLKDPNMADQTWLRYAVIEGLIPKYAYSELSVLYDGEIQYLDMGIGKLLNGLRDRGLLDNTALIFVSDHGEQIGEHSLIGHDFSLYNTLLHIPLLIRYPDQFPPGTISNDLIQMVDLMPSILEIANIEWTQYKPQIQGYPIQEIIRKNFKHDVAVAEYDSPDVIFSTLKKDYPSIEYKKYARSLKSIQTDRYKYIWASDGKHELYDLQSDPGEEMNILEQSPEVADDLDHRLKKWLTDHRNENQNEIQSDSSSSNRLKNSLKSLGYVN